MTYKMPTYHKIQTLFKRELEGKHKGRMIRGDWTTPELEYLANNEWEFTEKVDGTNIRIGFYDSYHGYPRVAFAGRSDNAVIPTPLLEYLEATFTPELFANADMPECVLFGEGFGPKIQGGGKYREDHAFVLFDVYVDGWWLKRDAVNDIAAKLGIESVPVIGYGTLQDAIDIVETGVTFNKGGGIERWGNGGLKSQWGNFEAEGIVARPKVHLTDRAGNRIITKIKGVDFK